MQTMDLNYSKFFPIFSLLFGIGISMQALKLYDKKQLSFSFFARRMGILFLFGVLHILFLWSGDVLHLYAMLGLLVTCLINRSGKFILVLSAVLLFFPFYDQIFGYLFSYLNYQPDSYLEGFAGSEVTRIIREGTYLEGMHLRVLEYIANIPILYSFLAPVALSMFLLGMYLGKKRIWNSLESAIKSSKKAVLTITVLTNCYRIFFLFFLFDMELYTNESLRPFFFKIMFLSDLAMALFYLWGIGWIWYNSHIKFILKPLKYVGRMALTNYIMHSVIGLFLFSSLGFQLYETLSPSQTLFAAFIVFGFQIIYSRIWLTFFKYGPLEWVWRCLTYNELLPIRKRDTLSNTVVTPSGRK